MSTLSLRMSESEYNLVREYANANGVNMSTLARNAILDKIEDDFSMDEARILRARERAHLEKVYSHSEAWEAIGV